MRLLLAALLLVHGAAIGQTFACQYTAAAGLDWEDGRWKTRSFFTNPPFFLKIEAGRLTPNILDKTVVGFSLQGYCEPERIANYFNCSNGVGTFLFFDPTALAGAISEVGSAITKHRRGSMSVQPFTCQQM